MKYNGENEWTNIKDDGFSERKALQDDKFTYLDIKKV